MELRIARKKPGEFSIHSEDGERIENAEHLETRYRKDRIITHVRITTRAKDLGKFNSARSVVKKTPDKGKDNKEKPSGSESKPA